MVKEFSLSCARPDLSATLVVLSSSTISSTVEAVEAIGFVQGSHPRLRYLLPFLE